MKIQNAPELFFPESNQYQLFRQAWSKAVRSPRVKSFLVDGQDFDGYPINVRRFGWLTSCHHLVYAGICGQDVRRIFNPLTNPAKLEQWRPLSALHLARCNLNALARVIDSGEASNYRHIRLLQGEVRRIDGKFLDAFLEPFAGTLTCPMLSKLARQLPPVSVKEDALCCTYSSIEEAYNR